VAVVSLTMRRALLVTLAASVLTQSSENQRLREELKAANSRLSTLKSTLRAELTRVFALLDGDGGGWGPVRTPAARPGRITDNCSFGPCLGLAKSDGHSRNTHKHVQGLLPARHLPRCCATAGLSSEWMRQATEANKTLLRYFYPAGTRAADLAGERRNAAGALERPDGKPIQKAWYPTSGCRIVPAACYCFHVTGSPVKDQNPSAWMDDGVLQAAHPSKTAAHRMRQNDSLEDRDVQANCTCLAPTSLETPRCIFGDMRPGKLLAVIGACRRLGITHIIEEGRYGGLSALVTPAPIPTP